MSRGPRSPKTRQTAGDEPLERRRVLEAEVSAAGAIIDRHVAPSHRYALVIFDPHPAGGIAYGSNLGEARALDVARVLIRLIEIEGKAEAS